MNLDNNSIKTIVFSNNENKNEDNNEIENVIFNNNERNNIENFIFENQNIIIEKEVTTINNDIIYIRELENQLLSSYPVSKQNLKYVQQETEKIAKKIIDTKNIGLQNYEMFKKGIEYSFINDIINNDFNDSYVIPIVLDKHKIYSKLKDNKNIQDNNNPDIYFTESQEDPNGIIEDNQRVQMINMKSLFHNRSLNNISYKDYINRINDITKSYITQYDESNKVIGHIEKPSDNTTVLRYYDLNSIYWNSYKIRNDYITVKDIFDENGKIKGIEDNILLKGDDINIVGFMILNDKIDKNFVRNNDITKIINQNNSIIIECKDHGLVNNEIIYIEDSNSNPSINNKYSKLVNIIDNNTIQLNIDLKLMQNGNYGKLYSIPKLKFDLYKVVKNEKNVTFELEKSYNNEINNNRNKVYLFDDISISINNYEDIIKNMMPTLNDIIKININKIKRCNTFDDINNIIKKYYININDLKIEQISLIKDILKNNLEKISIEEDNFKKINLNKHNKKLFKDNSYFLSDLYIKDKDIEKVYGKYPHLNKIEDNIQLRLKWIESQKDNGYIYYLNYSSKNKTFTDKKYIEDKIVELNDLLKMLQSNIKKEGNTVNKSSKLYKYQAYIITDEDELDGFKNLKNILPDKSVVFYKDNLYLWFGKMKEFENIEENTLALVGDNIWVWKKNRWYKSDSVPKYENIKYLCELNNLDISDIKLDSLDCIYRKDFGCESKIYVRLKDNIDKITNYLNNFERLKSYNNKISDKIDILKKKYYSNSNNVSKINIINYNKSENNGLEKIKDKLSVYLNLISSIKDYNKKLNYIYNLIEKDGIIIDNNIYSKKYKRKIPFCSHYYYFQKIEYADSPDQKIILIDTLLNKFSDFGATEKNIHVCKICGEFIINNNYDETEGFNENGKLISSRELWIHEIVEDKEVDFLKEVELTEKNLTDFLLKYGMTIDNISEATYLLTFITKNLYPKIGIKLPNLELINILIDSIQKIKNIIPYSYYRVKEIKKLEDKGFSKIDIDKIESKNTFKIGYDRYYNIKKNSIIITRLLISIQTIIPQPVRYSKKTVCVFNSFDGDEGIIYMTCVLNEMNLIILKDKTKSFDIIKGTITEIYNDLKNMSHIKKLFEYKDTYLKELDKKRETYVFTNEDNRLKDNNNLIEPIEVGQEYNNLIRMSKNILDVKKLKTVLFNRLKFLSKNIKKTVKNVISNSQLSDSFIGHVESSCCTEEAEQYLNYYFYIETESTYPIKKEIDESNIIYDYTKYFINTGSIHKCLFYDKYKFDGIYNNPIIDDEKNTSQNIINKVFEFFVDKGIYKGTQREYIGNVDIKSGLTRDEILSNKYSIVEYQQLLKDIENKNIKYYTDNKKILFQKNQLDNLKKDSIQKLDNEINKLVKNISIILNKDNVFIDNYVNLIRSFGFFNNNTDNILLSEKDKIKQRESINKKKTDYIKKFYITKLKKYLSIIKNFNDKKDIDIELDFIDDKKIKKEIQMDIYKDNNKLDFFLNENIFRYFIDLKLNFTNEEINSINGIDDVYDSNYNKIKEYSNFNFNDASNVLLYIFVQQLNDFILCNIDSISIDQLFNNDIVYDIDNKNTKCKYICNFIMILFDELEYDNQLFNFCKDGVKGIENSKEHERIEFKIKQFVKTDDQDYFTTMMQRKLSTKTLIDESLELAESELVATDLITEDLNFESGTETKIIEEGEEGEEYMYDLSTTVKGMDVIDQGANYGDFNDFDFEDGDGFDYSDEIID